MFCKYCGKEIPEESIQCPECGESLKEAVAEEEIQEVVDNPSVADGDTSPCTGEALDGTAEETASENEAAEEVTEAAEEAAQEETPQEPKVPLGQKIKDALAPLKEKMAAAKAEAEARKAERQALKEAEKAAKAQAEAMQKAEAEAKEKAQQEAKAQAPQEAPKAEETKAETPKEETASKPEAPKTESPKLDFGSRSPKADAAPKAETKTEPAKTPYGSRRSSDPGAVSIRTEKHIERILVRQVKLHKRITLMSAAGIALFAVCVVLFVVLLLQIHSLRQYNIYLMDKLVLIQEELEETEPPTTEPIVVPIPPEFTEPVEEETEPAPTDENGNPIETEPEETTDSPITITKQPTNERVSEWSDLSASIFTVTAEGEGLTFQWQKWDKEDAKWNNIQTGGVYLIYNGDGQTALMLAKFSDDIYGKYRCVITNEYGGTAETQYAEIQEP